MKKQLLSLVMMLLPMMAISQNTVNIDDVYYKLSSETKEAQVTKKPSGWYTGSVDIPPSVTYEGEEYSVTSIGNSAFDGSSSLTSVTIPNSVKSIGNSAFKDCYYMTSLTIPNSVKSIGKSAFSQCFFLTSVTIPDGVTSLEYAVFYGCSGLTSITIPESVTTIGNTVFSGCTGLTSVTIPNSVTSIGNAAFYGCSGLTSITISNSVTSIGFKAFAYCSNLTNLYCYAEQVPETDSRVFNNSNCANVTLHVPAASVEAYSNAEQWKDFGSIVALTNSNVSAYDIQAPNADGVTIYYNYINQGTELEVTQSSYSSEYWGTVIIPDEVTVDGHTLKVTSIGKAAFTSSPGLTSVTIGNNVTTIEEGAFYGCADLTSVTIGNNVTTIGDLAFGKCGGLTAVTIPNSVTTIGKYAFWGVYLETSKQP